MLKEYTQINIIKEIIYSLKCKKFYGFQSLPTGDFIPQKSKFEILEGIRNDLKNCTRCNLFKNRNKIVFGEGNLDALIIFVGEAPGRDEDLKGRPFVGKAGQLLTKIIKAMGFERSEVYIANVIKCRPPENRNPEPEEIKACEEFLKKQIELVNPKVICAMGKFAAQTLLNSQAPISLLRGNFHDYNGKKLMATYHPANLLRYPENKKLVWTDMKMIIHELNRKG